MAHNLYCLHNCIVFLLLLQSKQSYEIEVKKKMKKRQKDTEVTSISYVGYTAR